jgi:hypothetical protein
MSLVDRIREKISTGKLPTQGVEKRWAGHGTGAICDTCDFPITDLEHEFDADGRVFRFHRACIIAWDVVRRQPVT